MSKMRSVWIVAALPLLVVGCRRDETDTTRTTSGTTEPRSAPMEPGTAAPTLSSEDREFMTKAAQGSMLEVALGQEVARKATSPDVKAFGERMVTDHGKAQTELKQLAAKKGVSLPSELDSDHKKDVDEMMKLSGGKLEKEYADDMVEDHEEDVKEFRKASQEARDPELRAWAAKTLPVLESHLSTAKNIKARTK